MVFGKLDVQNSILETALQATAFRNEVILNNIANEDTPGFKKSAVDFEHKLTEALEESNRTGRLDLSGARPSTRLVHSDYSYRLDGNNVDIEKEMVDLYMNSVRYDVMVNSVISNYDRINQVLTAR